LYKIIREVGYVAERKQTDLIGVAQYLANLSIGYRDDLLFIDVPSLHIVTCRSDIVLRCISTPAHKQGLKIRASLAQIATTWAWRPSQR
jgi:hypothetical protein